jgi:hypothetical protein
MVLERPRRASASGATGILSLPCGACDDRCPRWVSERRWGATVHVEETVRAVLHVLEHLEQKRLAVAGTLFPL